MTVRDRVEQLYEQEREHLYTYLLYFGVPPHKAQELTQDSFLKLYLTMEKGTAIDNPKAWLYRVAHNLAVRGYRREPVFAPLDPEAPAPTPLPDPERSAIEQQRRRALIEGIHALSPQQKHCLHLRVQGLRYREIADVVGISTSAVSEFLRRAVNRLRETVNG